MFIFVTLAVFTGCYPLSFSSFPVSCVRDRTRVSPAGALRHLSPTTQPQLSAYAHPKARVTITGYGLQPPATGFLPGAAHTQGPTQPHTPRSSRATSAPRSGQLYFARGYEVMMIVYPERPLPTPGQHRHSPQRHTAAGTAAPTTADTGNTVPQRANPNQTAYARPQRRAQAQGQRLGTWTLVCPQKEPIETTSTTRADTPDEWVAPTLEGSPPPCIPPLLPVNPTNSRV